MPVCVYPLVMGLYCLTMGQALVASILGSISAAWAGYVLNMDLSFLASLWSLTCFIFFIINLFVASCTNLFT